MTDTPDEVADDWPDALPLPGKILDDEWMGFHRRAYRWEHIHIHEGGVGPIWLTTLTAKLIEDKEPGIFIKTMHLSPELWNNADEMEKIWIALIEKGRIDLTKE